MIPEFDVRDKHSYMDNAATTVMDQAVIDAMLPFLEERYGNPDTVYELGSEAAGAVEDARKQIAEVLGCRSREVFFTSGGTEANNWAIKGIRLDPIRRKKGCILASQVEHVSVLESVNWQTYHFPDAYTSSLLSVDSVGRVDMVQLKDELENGDVGLVSIQYGNNEVGTLQPVVEIAELCHKHGAIFHCDACQAFGRIKFDVEDCGFDLVSISAHKIHGPMGMGALYIKDFVDMEPLMHGGGQESGLRSGTLAVPSVVGFGVAAKLAMNDKKGMENASRLVEMMAAQLVGSCDAVRNGDPVDRLPHILSVTLPHNAAPLVGILSKGGVCVSMGSACRSRKRESHVLKAMGMDFLSNNRTIRISPSRYTEDIEAIALVQAIQKIHRDPSSLEYM